MLVLAGALASVGVASQESLVVASQQSLVDSGQYSVSSRESLVARGRFAAVSSRESLVASPEEMSPEGSSLYSPISTLYSPLSTLKGDSTLADVTISSPKYPEKLASTGNVVSVL